MPHANLFDCIEEILGQSLAEVGFESQLDDSKLVIRETGTEYVVELALPGFEARDIKLSIENSDTMRIHGMVEKELAKGQERGFKRTITSKISFDHRARFPQALRADAASASFKNGMLTVKLPKSYEPSA